MRSAVPRSLLMLSLALAACGKGGSPLEYVVHQSVVVADAGTAKERRVEILEDGRLTPAMRDAMWGGSKNPADFLDAPGVNASNTVKDSIRKDEVLHAKIRLADHDGHTIVERKLDCELAEIAGHPFPLGTSQVWALGNDCTVPGGSYAGLITHLFTVAEDKLVWQGYTDDATGEQQELTLVEAGRIRWQPATTGRLDDLLEVSSHPDFQDPKLASLPAAAPLPPDAPYEVEYIRYRYDAANGWRRQVRVEKPASWTDEEEFPALGRFPQ